MRSTREIQEQIRTTIQGNLSKMIISLIVMMVITSVSSFVLAIPLVLMMEGNLSIGSILGLVALVFISECITVFLFYGFTIMLGRFYRNERAVIGHLFFGFRDWKRILIISALLSVIGLIVAALVAVPSVAIYTKALANNEALLTEATTGSDTTAAIQGLSTIYKYLPLFFLAYALIVFAIIVRFSFIFPIMYHEKDISTFAVLKKSALLLKRKIFKLIGFCIGCAKYPLITTVVTFICSIFITNDSINTFLSLAYQVSLYYCVIYVLLAINAYYYEIADPDTLCISSPETPQQN